MRLTRALTLLVAAALSTATLSIAAPAAAEEPRRQTAETATMVLKIVHPTEVREALIAAAKTLGGFPTLVTNDTLHLKVPPEGLPDLLTTIADAGLVLDKSQARADLTARIAQLEGQLRSKAEILARLRTLIADSNVAATLKIEQSMTALVNELEQVKGQLRVELERVRYAVVQVSFSFQERDRMVYVRSPFRWLNGVDLDRFVQEF